MGADQDVWLVVRVLGWCVSSERCRWVRSPTPTAAPETMVTLILLVVVAFAGGVALTRWQWPRQTVVKELVTTQPRSAPPQAIAERYTVKQGDTVLYRGTDVRVAKKTYYDAAPPAVFLCNQRQRAFKA